MSEFFKILKAVCTGTYIFPFLLHTRFFKAFSHLLILAFFAAAFITAFRILPLNDLINTVSDRITEKLGVISFEKDGIYHSRNRDNKLSFSLLPEVDMLSFPSRDEIDTKMVLDSLSYSGIVYSPDLIFYWIKNNGKISVPLYLSHGEPQNYEYAKVLTVSQFTEFVDKLKKSTGKLFFVGADVVPYKELFRNTLVPVKVDLQNYKKIFFYLSVIMTFITWGVTIVMTTVWYCLLFIGIFYLMNSNTLGKVKFSSLFSVSIYVGFPPIIIASFFPAFALPYMDYETVYYIAFLIYLFVVLGIIQRYISTPKITIV